MRVTMLKAVVVALTPGGPAGDRRRELPVRLDRRAARFGAVTSARRSPYKSLFNGEHPSCRAVATHSAADRSREANRRCCGMTLIPTNADDPHPKTERDARRPTARRYTIRAIEIRPSDVGSNSAGPLGANVPGSVLYRPENGLITSLLAEPDDCQGLRVARDDREKRPRQQRPRAGAYDNKVKEETGEMIPGPLPRDFHVDLVDLPDALRPRERSRALVAARDQIGAQRFVRDRLDDAVGDRILVVRDRRAAPRRRRLPAATRRST